MQSHKLTTNNTQSTTNEQSHEIYKSRAVLGLALGATQAVNVGEMENANNSLRGSLKRTMEPDVTGWGRVMEPGVTGWGRVMEPGVTGWGRVMEPGVEVGVVKIAAVCGLTTFSRH